MSGITISTRRPTSSTFTSRGCEARSRRASISRSCIRFAVPAICSRAGSAMALSVPAIMKTTAARLSALYFLLFAICAVLLVLYMTSLSARMLTAQTQDTINDEVLGLARAYQRGGLPLLVRVVEQRSRQPGANLYLIADANGQILTGNVQSLEPGVLENEGWTTSPFSYQRFGEGELDRLRNLPADKGTAQPDQSDTQAQGEKGHNA